MRLFYFFLTFSCIALSGALCGQAVFRSNANIGSWTATGSWNVISGTDPDGIPDDNDSVVIRSGHVIYVASNQSCRGLSFLASSGSDTSTLIVNASVQFNVSNSNGSGKVAMPQTSSRHMRITVNGTMIVSSDLTMTNTGTGINMIHIGSAGSLDVGGVLKLDNNDGTKENLITGTPAATPTGTIECDSLAMIQPNDPFSEDNLIQHPLTVVYGAYMYIPADAGYLNSITGNVTVGRGLIMDNDADFPGDYDNLITGNVTITGSLTMTAVSSNNTITGSVTLTNGALSMSGTDDGENTIGNGFTATSCTGFSMVTAGGSASYAKNQIAGNVSLTGSVGTMTMTGNSYGDGTYSNRISGDLTAASGNLSMTINSSGLNSIGGTVSTVGNLSMLVYSTGDNIIGSAVSLGSGGITMLTQASGGLNTIGGNTQANGTVDIDNLSAGSNTISGNLTIGSASNLTMDVNGSGNNNITGAISTSGSITLTAVGSGNNILGSVTNAAGLTMNTSSSSGDNTVSGTTNITGNLSLNSSATGINTLAGSVTAANGSITLSSSGNGGNHLGKHLTSTGCTGFTMQTTVTASTGVNMIDSNVTVTGTGNILISASNTGNEDPFLVILIFGNNVSNAIGGTASFTTTGTFMVRTTGGNSCPGENHLVGAFNIANASTITFSAGSAGNNRMHSAGNVNSSSGTVNFLTTASGVTGDNVISGLLTASPVSEVNLTANSDGNNNLNGGAVISASTGLNLATSGGDTYDGDNLINGTLTLTAPILHATASSDGDNRISGAILTLSSNLSLINSNASGSGGRNDITISGTSAVGGNVIFTSGLLEGQNTLRVNANLVINGSTGLSMTSGSNSGTDGVIGADNRILLGAGAISGSVTLNGISMASPQAGASPRNQVYLENGTLDINGNITLSGNSQTRNEILWNDDFGSGDGYTKQIYFSGTISDILSGSLIRYDTDDDAPFTFTFDGTTVQQTIPGNDFWQFKRVDVINTYANVLMGGTLSRAGNRLRGRLKLYDNVTLQDNGNSFGGTGNDSIQMLANSRFFITNLTDAFPAMVENVNLVSSAIIEFNNTGGSTQMVLGGSGSTKTLYKVEGTGTGIKEVQNNLTAANISIESIHLKGGTWTFASASALTFNLRADVNLPTQTFIADAYTTLKIPRDFSATPSLKYSFDYLSTVEYSRAGNQTMYKMCKNTPGSGELAPLGNLTLSGSGTKDLLIADSIKVRRKVTIGTGTTLEVSNNSALILASDVSYTAWVGPVLGGITYNGTGKIIAQRYLSFANKRYRDISTPIKTKTLQTWKNAGVTFQGFTGANTESAYYGISAYKYNETMPGNLDQRWTPANNITNEIHTFDGGAIKQGAWRIFIGSALGKIYLLQDSGQIYTGDITFKTTFTHGSDTYTRAYDDGWNLLGNPYPAAIDWEAVVNDPANTNFKSDSLTDGLSPTFYQWMPYDNGVGNIPAAYSSYNAVTNISFGNTLISSLIPAFQGFWVKSYHSSASSASYNFTIKESHKADTAGTFRKYNSPDNTILAKIKLTDPAGNSDQVGMHFWPKSTDGFDRLYDIQRFGPAASGTLNINYSADGTPLQLFVNAIPPSMYNYSYKFSITTPVPGVYNLSFDNLEQLIAEFDCAFLLDLDNNAKINLKEIEVYSFTSSAGYTGERFQVVFSRKIPQAEIITKITSCQGYENGLLSVKLTEYNKESNFTLYRDTNAIETFKGNIKSIKRALAAGNYTLVDNSISLCSYVYAFVINDPEPVIAKFELATTRPTAGKEVRFINRSAGATTYSWYFDDDMSTSTSKDATHIYRHPGYHNVTLTAGNEDPSCISVQKQQVRVYMKLLPGIIENPDFTLIKSGNSLKIINEGMVEAGVDIFTVEGKLLWSKQRMDVEETVPELKSNNIYIVVFKSVDKVTSYKIAF